MEVYHDVEELDLCCIKFNAELSQNYIIAKRLSDIAISVVMIVLSIPIFILIALAIKLTSKGPILFLQERRGQYGNMFIIYKFRTMYDDSPFLMGDSSIHGSVYKRKNDERVTPIGKFLRKSSLDELPQFFNVLKGDMSIVGPRPLIDYMLKPYMQLGEVRTSVKPGITGLWQVTARAQCSNLLDMIEYDLDYIENASLTYDFKIMLATVWVVLIGKGAY